MTAAHRNGWEAERWFAEELSRRGWPLVIHGAPWEACDLVSVSAGGGRETMAFWEVKSSTGRHRRAVLTPAEHLFRTRVAGLGMNHYVVTLWRERHGTPWIVASEL